MIKISGLSKTYAGHVTALQQVNLEIGPGMFGLIGPNGAGKTTLMRILAGLVQPSGGQVLVFGHEVNTPAGKMAVKAQLGYLPQELGLYPNLTALEFLDYVARLKGVIDKKRRHFEVHQVLERVRLAEVAQRRLETYSGGMKRRVGIAQALLGQPRLLIVDEPSAGLDPEERIRLRNLLAEVAATCTVILSSHIIEDINQSCRALAVIQGGRVLFQGTPAELAAQAQGQVWTVETREERPMGSLAIISSLPQGETTRYRLLGRPAGYPEARAIEPGLEDGYMWLISQAQLSTEPGAEAL